MSFFSKTHQSSLNGKEGRGDFRKNLRFKGGLVGFRKIHHYGKGRKTGVVSDSSLQRAVAA